MSCQIQSFLLSSRQVISDYLQPHGLQHARLPCPPPSSRVCSNSYSSSQWCYPTMHELWLSSPPVFIFPSISVFSNESVLRVRWPRVLELQLQHFSPSNEYSELIPSGLTGLISLLSRAFSRVFSNTTTWKHQFFRTQPSLWFNCHIQTLTTWTFVNKIMSLLFNIGV